MVDVILKADSDQGLINRNIYGHFSEHLGRCIYEGLWVGGRFTYSEYGWDSK